MTTEGLAPPLMLDIVSFGGQLKMNLKLVSKICKVITAIALLVIVIVLLGN